MKSFTQNSDSNTKWLTPDIVHYIVDRERFRTQLLCWHHGPCPKWNTSCALVVLRTYNGGFAAVMRHRSALLPTPHWCKLAADFYPTVKAALRHESADSEEDREGLGCRFGQGHGRHTSRVFDWGCHVTCGNEALLPHRHATPGSNTKRCPVPAIHLYQYNNYINHVMPICMYFFF